MSLINRFKDMPVLFTKFLIALVHWILIEAKPDYLDIIDLSQYTKQVLRLNIFDLLIRQAILQEGSDVVNPLVR